MNVLVISGLYSEQPKSGGSLVMKCYVEELRKQGHQVYLLYENTEDTDALQATKHTDTYYIPSIKNEYSANRSVFAKVKARANQYIDKKRMERLPKLEQELKQYFYTDYTFLSNWVAQFLKSHSIDIIQVDFPWLMNLPAHLPFNIPIVFVSHEMQAVKNEREAHRANDEASKQYLLGKAKAFKQQEIGLAQKFDAILTLTDVEATFWQQLLPKTTVKTSPLGIDIQIHHKLTVTKAEKIVFVGSGKHFPNVDGLQWFIHEIWPQVHQAYPEIKFYITGEYDDQLKATTPQSNQIIWAGFVYNLAALMHNAVSIVPIRIGSGIRIKILESMAMGAPVVSTHMAAEGIIATPNASILLADEPTAFANQVIALLTDEELYTSISESASREVVANYQVQHTVNQRVQFFNKLLSKS